MNNFVALDICPYCGQPKGIAIHKKLKDLPQECMTSPEPCDKCRETFIAKNAVPVWSTFIDSKGKVQFKNEYFFIRRDTVRTPEIINMMNTSGFLIMKENEFEEAKKYMETQKERIHA